MNIQRHLLKRILQEIRDKIFENGSYKNCGQRHLKKLEWYSLFVHWNIWDRIFKNGQNKICGRQPLKIWSDMVSTEIISMWNFFQYYLEHLSKLNFTIKVFWEIFRNFFSRFQIIVFLEYLWKVTSVSS